MNEVKNRFFVALFCIVYTLGMNWYSIYSTALYYIILTTICLYEYHYQIETTRKKITILLSLAIYLICIGYVLDLVDIKRISIVLPIIMSLFSIELFSGKNNPMLSIGTDLIGLVWICLPFLLTVALSYQNEIHDHSIVSGIMTFVFMTDTGAYFGGKYFGKTKLCPTISPKKTWEGLGFGVLTSICSYPIVYSFTNLGFNKLVGVMIISIISGIIGDLVESMFKRDLKIKDTSNTLGSHGGCLDRLDSLLYAVPFVYAYLCN